MTKEKTENILSILNDTDKCYLLEGFAEREKDFAIHLLSNFPSQILAKILLDRGCYILLTRFPRLRYLFQKASMSDIKELELPNVFAFIAEMKKKANKISDSKDIAYAKEVTLQLMNVLKNFVSGQSPEMISNIFEAYGVQIEFDFAVRLANIEDQPDDFEHAYTFLEEFVSNIGNPSVQDIRDKAVEISSDESIPYMLAVTCEEEDSNANIFCHLIEKLQYYCRAAWFVKNNYEEYLSITNDIKRHGTELSMLDHQDGKIIELCCYYEDLNTDRNLASMFFEYVLNADLDLEIEQTILEFLARHRLSAIAKREYAEFKNKHANAKEISFIEDKAIVTPLSHLEQWTEEKLQLLFRNLKKGGFIASKTQDDDFLAVFGCTTAKYPLDLEPIRWTGTYRGKPGVKQIIDLLSLMGYKCDELKGGDLLKDLNSCFAVGEGFKSNSFQRGTESDKHETLAEIVEKCLKK